MFRKIEFKYPLKGAKIVSFLSLLIAILFALPGISFAQTPNDSKQPARAKSSNCSFQRSKGVRPTNSGINIADRRSVKGKYSDEINKSRVQIKQIRLEVAKILSSPNPDKQKVKNSVNRMMDIRRKQQLLLVEQMFDNMEGMSEAQKSEYLQPFIERCLR